MRICKMRTLWCYGSERFWNYCGRTITDRAHPLRNFVKSINRRRAVDGVPQEYVRELLAFAQAHDLSTLTEGINTVTGVPEPAAYSLRSLYDNMNFDHPAAPIQLDLLLPAFQQLSFPWGSTPHAIRNAQSTATLVRVCVCV